MPENSDPYLYPGTDVLRNLADLSDPVISAAFEANATAAGLIELAAAGFSGSFDVPHLKAIHRHLFQDVYSKNGAAPKRCPPFEIFTVRKSPAQLICGRSALQSARQAPRDEAGLLGS